MHSDDEWSPIYSSLYKLACCGSELVENINVMLYLEAFIFHPPRFATFTCVDVELLIKDIFERGLEISHRWLGGPKHISVITSRSRDGGFES